MGDRNLQMRVWKAPPPARAPELPAGVRRTRPRDYLEWKTLRRWGRLPSWEDSPPGYVLREAREAAGLTQTELAARLGRSQQAVAQAERWDSNPTVGFLRSWADATGTSLRLELGDLAEAGSPRHRR